MKLVWLLALLLAAAALPATAEARCALPKGWQQIGADRIRYVIFGELHGSAQSPAMVGQTACALSSKRDRLLVALELGDNAGLQRAWALPHAEFAQQLPVIMTEWKTRADGVTSQAVFDMIVQLHALKDEGRLIDLVGFNGAPDADQQRRFADLKGPAVHEAVQADNIRRAAETNRYRHVLVLVGNVHARKRMVTSRGVSYEPMAMRLAPPEQILSLKMEFAGGSVSACLLKGDPKPGASVANDDLDCSPHAFTGSADWKGEPRVVLLSQAPSSVKRDGNYDGAYFLGAITASPPKEAQP